MRLFTRRKTEHTSDKGKYVWLENVSDKHIYLHLDTGDLRLDKGRKLRFRPDALKDPQLKTLIENGQIVVRD